MAKHKKEIVREFTGELTRLTNKMRILEKKTGDFGTGEPLHTFEIHLIDAVGHGRGRTVTDLARWFMVTKGAVSQVVGKLEKGGYITKERNPDNGKEVWLFLTKKGRTALAGHESFHEHIDGEIFQEFQDVSAEKFEEFHRLLTRLNLHLDRYFKALKD